MSDGEKLGHLTARVERLESLRQRVYDVLPFAAVIALMVFVLAQLFSIDERLDRVEYTLLDHGAKLTEQGRQLTEQGRQLAEQSRRLEQAVERLVRIEQLLSNRP